MKKKIGLLSLLLVLAMCLAFLPGLQTEAEAAAASSITVNGYNLPSGYYLPTATWTKTTTKPSGSYFYYSGGTLTIYNVTLTSPSGTRAVYAEGDLIVSLSGTNKLTTNNANGIRSAGTLKFTGTGSLTVSSSGSYDAIYSSGNMEFAQTGTVTATATGGTSSGVECAAKLTIGGNLNATSESSYAIYASGDIAITKGTVNATGNCTYSAGGICSNGAITVSGGTLNVTSKSDGIISKYDFWQKAGNVTVNADWNGIVVETATNNVIIHEGTMTVTAVRNGLKAQKFYINGGHGYIKSTNTSSDSSYYAVKLAGNTSSYYVQKGNVNSYGSTTTSSSALTKLVYANLPTYDYVYFTGYVTVNGVELRDGYYLQSGKTTTDTTKPSGSYAYYSGNTLTLNNFEGSNNSASGIDSRYDLNIVLAQGSVNKLTTSAASGTSYCGINVSGTLKISGLGQLTITGGKYAIYSTGSMTLSSTQVFAIGGGIYSGSALNFKSASVGVYQLLSAASGTHAIQAAGDIDIDGAAGAVYINTPDKVNGNFVRGIVGKNITINSSVGITSSGVGIRGEGNVTISSGTVEVNAKLGSGIYAASTMKITGGIVDVTAYNNGLATNKLVVTGGDITAVSTYTGNDAANKAIEVANNTTTYFQIPSDYAFLASIGTTSSYNVGNLNDLGTYDWVHIGDFVELHGVELRSGYYLASGNSANTPTLVKPSSGDYAYYEDGVLTLCDYEYSGNAMAIRAFADLTVEMTGGSKINHIMSHAGDLTFKGTGALEIKRNMASDAVNVIGDVYVQNGLLTITGDDTCIYAGTGCTTGATTLKLTSNSRNGIQVLHGNFTMNGGDLDIYAKNDGINAERVTINGGTALIKSSNMTSDSNYSSIRTGNFVVGSGLRVIGSTDPSGSVAADIDVSKLRTYDYIKVDKASTIVSGPLNGTVTGMQETADVNLALYKSGQAEPAYKAVRLGNGSFTFTFVEYGTYTLKATATGYQDFTTTVTVSGSTPSVTVTMTKKSSGNITVECVGDISYTVSGSVVKVTHDVACKVGYLSGSEYVAITPTKNSDGSYSFTAPAGVTNVLLVVKGDVNGDGKVTSSDYSRLNAVLLKKTTLTAKASFAANCNTDTQVTSSDYSRLNAVLLKKTTMAW